MAIDTTHPITSSAVEAAAQSFNAHDLDALAEVLADDVVCRVPGGPKGAARRRASRCFLMLEQLGLA